MSVRILLDKRLPAGRAATVVLVVLGGRRPTQATGNEMLRIAMMMYEMLRNAMMMYEARLDDELHRGRAGEVSGHATGDAGGRSAATVGDARVP